MEHTKGYVYVLTNKSFRDDWVKIGKSSRPVDVRSKELDNTAVPLPFDIFATMQTKKYGEVERFIHKQIDLLTNLRIRPNREFFNVNPDKALAILLDMALTIDDAVVMKYEGGKPVQVYPVVEGGEQRIKTKKSSKTEKKGHRAPFDFSMVGLKEGDIIVFDALNLSVKVAGNNKVEHEGRLWSLSSFCVAFLPQEMHNSSESYQGPKYFSYQGKTLWQIRLERENK